MKEVLVVGGGAAGLIAAGTAAKMGNDVSLFEQNNILGRKVYITGKGRCNLTNASDTQNHLNHITGNSKFLFSAYNNFNSEDTIKLFNELGLATKVERGNRVFPLSDKSADVVKALKKFVNTYGVKQYLDTKITEIVSDGESIVGVKTENKIYEGDAVVISTGGLSYPATGSTGDGYKFAKSVGHLVTKLYPSLVSLKVKNKFVKELEGLSLKNVSIKLFEDDKEIFSDFGEMLFTSDGVSGPIILSASAAFAGRSGRVLLSIDLKPAINQNELDKRVLRDFTNFCNKDLKNSLNDLLPQKLIPVIIKLSGINPDKKVNKITKDERTNLVNILKGLKLEIYKSGGYDEAVVTKGGIKLGEVNPRTFESKLIKGLYFVGEVLDLDAYTGGYNLQIAFSTGYTAGINV